jgi:hypothetical protein
MSQQDARLASGNDVEKLPVRSKDERGKVEYGNPTYGAEDDIYSNEERAEGSVTDEESESNDLDENLDVPGADLDDPDEEIGEEDEENNYYSLGGDDHNELDEDNQ